MYLLIWVVGNKKTNIKAAFFLVLPRYQLHTLTPASSLPPVWCRGPRCYSQQVVGSLCCSFLLPSHLSLLLCYGLFKAAEPLRTAISSECTNQVPRRSASTRTEVSVTPLSWANSKCSIRVEMVWSSRVELVCAWQGHGHGCSAPASLLSVVLYFLLVHTKIHLQNKQTLWNGSELNV